MEEKIDEIYNLGLKHGFEVADFSSFGYVYRDEDYNRVKLLRKHK